ncbi:connector enhancer of kinase suppressor of ras 1 isoform X2 [Rana temporaria]|uniref:connector enhancer of kinase suppressor of ras 1 isoform X2 n=1 Tax=Rana temporaria TaxID=8407 RepID=UPI001AAD4ADD|nr:connector enhancer of kinase suppressor of ras 1 isoform X2 [Rana temporaria]
MELICSWSPGAVRAYLQGLEPSVQHYPFKEWDITGQDLLDLSPQHLDTLGVKSIGHQEVILEAVEQLCALHYDLQRESLRSLTDKLHRVAQLLCSHIITLKKASVSQPTTLSPTHKQLASIIDIVAAARGLFSWLNRYLFTRLNDYSASRDVIALCVELAEMLHKDWTDPKVEARILTICENIGVICKSILNCSPESLLNQTATLELVQIHPKPSDGLSAARECEKILPGDEIIKVNDQVVVGWTHKNLVRKLQEKLNCVTLILKKVSVSPAKSPVSSNKNKTREASPSSLMDSPPFSTYASHVPASSNVRGHEFLLKPNTAPVSPLKHKNLLATQSAPGFETENKLTSITFGSGAPQNLQQALSAENISGVSPTRPSGLGSQGHLTWSCPGASSKPLTSDVFLYLPPTSPGLPAQQEMSCSTIYAKTLTPLEQCSSEMESKNVKHSSRPRSGSDSTLPPVNSLLEPPDNLRPSISDSSLSKKTVAEVPQQSKRLDASSQGSQEKAKSPKTEKKLQYSDTDKTSDRSPRNQKATKLSRRRVSCRDLGSPDCDGWLWKKKENVGFMSQKWKHCYCVLKKDKLYWYNGPQDEKALGMLKLSSYNLESPLESKHKKKYEFQLTHQMHKSFIFAADNLTDMNKWVTRLVKTLQKYKSHANPNNSREEDCYSETEAEDDDHSKPQDVLKKQIVQSPLNITPGASPISIKEKGAEGVQMANVAQSPDDLELMMTCLKQGGVSLIGKKTAMTRDEYRKSFIKRNKNPAINHKAHALRVLQSTLKAKLQELEALNQILENPKLDSAIFQKWKSEHDQLYVNVGKGSQATAENAYSMDVEGSNDQKKQDSDESEASD